MVGLNSAKHLLNAGGGRCNVLRRSYCRRVVADTDDFVYVGKGFKICNKEEIEVPISNNRITKWQGHSKSIIKHNKRKLLPPNLLSRSVVRLTCESTAAGGICDVYLVGTNHERKETWKEVHDVIKYLKPQVVYLELCTSRLGVLAKKLDKVPTIREMLDMWKKNEDPFSILLKWFQAKKVRQLMRHHEVGYDEACETTKGGDVRGAYQEAMKYGGKVILGDVPQEITQRKILAKMSPWRYVFPPPDKIEISEDVYKTLKTKDEIDRANLVMQEVIKKYPNYWKPFMHERDLYMSAKILKAAREHNSVVAVVGGAHLAGIQKNWKQPIDVKQLLDTGAYKVTMGKMITTFGAMAVYASLPLSTIPKIQGFIWKNYSL